MNEDLPNPNQPLDDRWQAPPLPEQVLKTDEAPKMSEVGTLGNIFFEPGATFEDLRRKPRFLLAGILVVIAGSMIIIGVYEKIGFERITRERMENSSFTRDMPAAEKQKSIEMQSQGFVKYITYGSMFVVSLISVLIGGLIYWLGANAMGGTMTFLRGVSVWVYSSLPPTLISLLANGLVLFLKSADEMDVRETQTGVVHANPSFFIDSKTSPVLGALLGSFDFFLIWGWILAAIGLRITGKISSGAAWAIVLIVGLLNIATRVIAALFQ